MIDKYSILFEDQHDLQVCYNHETQNFMTIKEIIGLLNKQDFKIRRQDRTIQSLINESEMLKLLHMEQEKNDMLEESFKIEKQERQELWLENMKLRNRNKELIEKLEEGMRLLQKRGIELND